MCKKFFGECGNQPFEQRIVIFGIYQQSVQPLTVTQHQIQLGQVLPNRTWQRVSKLLTQDKPKPTLRDPA